MLLFEAEELSRHLLILLPVVSQGLLGSIAAGNLRLPSMQSKAAMSIESAFMQVLESPVGLLVTPKLIQYDKCCGATSYALGTKGLCRFTQLVCKLLSET